MAGRRKARKEGIENWERLLQEEEYVQQLVDKHHEHLKRDHAAIVVLGQPKAGKKHGKTTYATIRPAKKAEQLLFETGPEPAKRKVHYIITVGLDVWRSLSWQEKEAILDHELCHAVGINDKGKWGTRGHDVEQFVQILERRGPMSLLERDFVKVAKQLELPS